MTCETEGPGPEVYQKLAAPSLAPPQMGEYVGDYHSDELEVTYSVALEGERLLLRRRFLPPADLCPVARDRFRCQDFDLCFTRDDRNRIHALTVQGSRARGIRFAR